jgi:hypothetical protein
MPASVTIQPPSITNISRDGPVASSSDDVPSSSAAGSGMQPECKPDKGRSPSRGLRKTNYVNTPATAKSSASTAGSQLVPVISPNAASP